MSTSRTMTIASERTDSKRTPAHYLRRLGVYVALFVFLFVVLAPFFWIVKSALSRPDQLFNIPPVYIPNITFENFSTLANQVPLLTYIRNSLILSVGTAVLSVALAFLAAYAFARLEVPGRNVLLWLFVLTMALPEIATVIPLYRLLANLGLLDSLTGLVIIMSSVLTPFTVWVLVAFIQQVPYEIEEAAIIDGASMFQILFRVVLPLVTPALVTMLVINFINAWNNLIYPLAFSATDQSKTLSVAITEIFQARAPWGRPWNLVSTLGVTMVIPAIILVLVSQRAIVRGLTRGAIK
jgi:ABC-type glycerol-3-phosphate transport system permease component